MVNFIDSIKGFIKQRTTPKAEANSSSINNTSLASPSLKQDAKSLEPRKLEIRKEDLKNQDINTKKSLESFKDIVASESTKVAQDKAATLPAILLEKLYFAEQEKKYPDTLYITANNLGGRGTNSGVVSELQGLMQHVRTPEEKIAYENKIGLQLKEHYKAEELGQGIYYLPIETRIEADSALEKRAAKLREIQETHLIETLGDVEQFSRATAWDILTSTRNAFATDEQSKHGLMLPIRNLSEQENLINLLDTTLKHTFDAAYGTKANEKFQDLKSNFTYPLQPIIEDFKKQNAFTFSDGKVVIDAEKARMVVANWQEAYLKEHAPQVLPKLTVTPQQEIATAEAKGDKETALAWRVIAQAAKQPNFKLPLEHHQNGSTTKLVDALKQEISRIKSTLPSDNVKDLASDTTMRQLAHNLTLSKGFTLNAKGVAHFDQGKAEEAIRAWGAHYTETHDPKLEVHTNALSSVSPDKLSASLVIMNAAKGGVISMTRQQLDAGGIDVMLDAINSRLKEAAQILGSPHDQKINEFTNVQKIATALRDNKAFNAAEDGKVTFDLKAAENVLDSWKTNYIDAHDPQLKLNATKELQAAEAKGAPQSTVFAWKVLAQATDGKEYTLTREQHNQGVIGQIVGSISNEMEQNSFLLPGKQKELYSEENVSKLADTLKQKSLTTPNAHTLSVGVNEAKGAIIEQTTNFVLAASELITDISKNMQTTTKEMAAKTEKQPRQLDSGDDLLQAPNHDLVTQMMELDQTPKSPKQQSSQEGKENGWKKVTKSTSAEKNNDFTISNARYGQLSAPPPGTARPAKEHSGPAL